jgi:hypothetical protein
MVWRALLGMDEWALESGPESEESLSLAQHFSALNPHTNPLPANLTPLARLIQIQEFASTSMLDRATTSVVQGTQEDHGY